MLPQPDSDLPPLKGLDALDEERAADMVYNRPHYSSSAPPSVPPTAPPQALEPDEGTAVPVVR
jgi:hypothetical protein